MASAITHVVLAVKVLSLLPPSIDHKAFIVGTCFPDIRYMAGIPRERTHIRPVSWQRVCSEPSSFRAGMMFHNLVDEIRMHEFEIQFYDRHASHLYTPLYIMLFPLFMKFAEDRLLYAKVHNWHEIASYFDTIYPEERLICLDERMIRRWHYALAEYFVQEPTLKSIDLFLSRTANPIASIDSSKFDVSTTFWGLVHSHYFCTSLQQFYDEFETFLGMEIAHSTTCAGIATR